MWCDVSMYIVLQSRYWRDERHRYRLCRSPTDFSYSYSPYTFILLVLILLRQQFDGLVLLPLLLLLLLSMLLVLYAIAADAHPLHCSCLQFLATFLSVSLFRHVSSSFSSLKLFQWNLRYWYLGEYVFQLMYWHRFENFYIKILETTKSQYKTVSVKRIFRHTTPSVYYRIYLWYSDNSLFSFLFFVWFLNFSFDISFRVCGIFMTLTIHINR